jgi:hypothetical protein
VLGHCIAGNRGASDTAIFKWIDHTSGRGLALPTGFNLRKSLVKGSKIEVDSEKSEFAKL